MDNKTDKESILGILDKLDDMNITNLTFLESTETLYKIKLKAVETFAKDSKTVNIESTMLRAQLEGVEEMSQEEKIELLKKMDSMRVRLSAPLSYFGDLSK